MDIWPHENHQFQFFKKRCYPNFNYINKSLIKIKTITNLLCICDRVAVHDAQGLNTQPGEDDVDDRLCT